MKYFIFFIAILFSSESFSQINNCEKWLNKSDSVLNKSYDNLEKAKLFYKSFLICLNDENSGNLNEKLKNLNNYNSISIAKNKKGGWGRKHNNELGFIDSNYNWLKSIPKEYYEVSAFSPGSNSFWMKSLKNVYEPEYSLWSYDGYEVASERYAEARGFIDGVGAVRDGWRWYLINEWGKLLNKTGYQQIFKQTDGLSLVQDFDNKFGYINATGNQIIQCIYDSAESFNNKIALVSKYGKWGYLNVTGVEIIKCQYDELGNFKDRIVLAKKSGKYGFLDISGKDLTGFNFDLAGSFNESRAIVSKNNLFGFIDVKGELVIPLIYNSCYNFNSGIALVSKGNKWGYINPYGIEITSIEYDDAYEFNEGLATVVKNNKFGFVNEKGIEVIPLIYDKAEDFKNGESLVSLNNKSFYIDRKGQKIREAN